MQPRFEKKNANTISVGFSLIEILVAMAVGVTVTVMATNYYVLNFQMANMSINNQYISNAGAAALLTIGNHIEDAGNGGAGPWTTLSTVIEPATTGCVEPGPPSFCSENNSTGSDSIAIRLNPQNNLTCDGTPVLANEIIVNQFYISPNNELMCRSYSVTNGTPISSPYIVQNNIEDMQIEYFLSDGTTTSDPDNLSSGVWGVTVSLLVSGINPNPQVYNQSFKLLDAPVKNFPASVTARKVFQSTFVINSTFRVRAT